MNPAATRKNRIRVVDRTRHLIYLKKAKEFYQTMYQAENAENWNAVGLNGVHCIISFIDALLVKYSGVRSIGADHMAAAELLDSPQISALKGFGKKVQLAKRVIAKKNLVEYEDRDFSRGEALELLERVQKFHDWATWQL